MKNNECTTQVRGSRLCHAGGTMDSQRHSSSGLASQVVGMTRVVSSMISSSGTDCQKWSAWTQLCRGETCYCWQLWIIIKHPPHRERCVTTWNKTLQLHSLTGKRLAFHGDWLDYRQHWAQTRTSSQQNVLCFEVINQGYLSHLLANMWFYWIMFFFINLIG